MPDTERLLHLAVERGWITPEQARPDADLETLLSPEQIEQLRAGRKLASRVLESGLLKGEALAEPAPLRFGRYTLIRELGQGGSGRVYLARDPELGREIAIKILDRGVAAQPERFRREMGILAALRHPNIVTIYDAGSDDGRPYYAMEYAPGRSLAETKLPLAEAVKVLEQVALACHAAHEKGIVHRDLKPANVLLADRPLVADFGIAKVADAERTETGMTLGTPSYMSPEQAAGLAVDARSDVFSMGTMLYEMMTGRRPFTGTNVYDIAAQVAKHDPVRPRAIDGSLPRDLEIIAFKAMAKRPERRYASARAFAEDLRAWQEGRPIAARPPSLRERTASLLRRHPRLLYSGVAAVTLLTFFSLFRSPAWHERRRFEEAQAAILPEVARIQAWQVNLYKRAREMSYGELEMAVSKMRPFLNRADLSPTLRLQGHSAAARAYLHMGRMQEAREELDRAIGAGAGGRIGEEYFERARLTWEELLREAIAKNDPETERLLPIVAKDLDTGLKSGFQDDWYRDFAQAFLRLVREKQKAVEATLAELDRLSKFQEKRPEEVIKFRGDLYLLMKKHDEAAAQYGSAIGVRECYVQAWNGLALSHALKGRGENASELQEAFRAASKAIEINPRYEGSYFLFGLLCRDALKSPPRELKKMEPDGLKLVEEAVAKLRLGAQVRPDSSAIRLAHGAACVLWGFGLHGQRRNVAPAVDEAVASMSAAIGQDAGRYEPWFVRGAAHLLRGLADPTKREAFEQSGRDFAEAASRAPGNAAVHRWLGARHYAAGNFAGAAAEWKRALELDPGARGDLEADIAEAERRK
ncbi:MAG TPA: serine/threonine-protein kinase [Planctomycetota bacterium]|nr:serine/threonine-protein kinase [Planctomycetota bacterium]